MQKKHDDQQPPQIPADYTKREHTIIITVLLAVIICGTGYLFMSNGRSEEYRAPDASSVAADDVDYSFDAETEEPTELLEGLPEVAKSSDNEAAADAPADEAPVDETLDAAPAEAPTTDEAPADAAPVVRKVTTKKIDEEIKTTPDPEPTIVE